MTTASILSVSGLSCRIDRLPILADVTFVLERGGRLGIVGPSGSGKTMCLRCLLGLAPKRAVSTGVLEVDGHRVDLGQTSLLSTLRGRSLALLPQQAAASLDPVRRIGDQIAELIVLHGRSVSGPRLLERAGLAPTAERLFPGQLSGGMAQRVALALALACQPSVLLADEPTSSLDAVTQLEVLRTFDETCGSQTALVLVSHDIATIAHLCPRLLVFHAGRIVEHGSTEELLARPNHPVTHSLVAAARRRQRAFEPVDDS